MPPAYLFIHPVLGLLIVTLVVGAFAMKEGAHKFWALHYVTGLAAGLGGVTAFGLGLWAVMQRTTETNEPMPMPLIAILHLIVGALGVLALLTQMALGLAMRYTLGGPPKFIRYHRFNSRLLLGLTMAIFLLGVLTLGTLML